MEELSAQLQSSLRGEKDWHDRVVEAYEQQIRDRHKEQQEKLQEMLEAHREEFGNRSVVGGTELRGLTADEVQERITRRKQLDAQRVAQRIVQPQLVEKTDQLQRWGLIDPPVSGTFSQTDRDTSQAAPIPITRPTTPGRPFRR